MSRRIEAITEAGIPFMAHIGMLPQSVKQEGGYRIKGRTNPRPKRCWLTRVRYKKPAHFCGVGDCAR